MSRSLGPLGVAAAFAFALTACGDDDGTTAGDTPSDQTTAPEGGATSLEEAAGTGDGAATEATGSVAFDGRELVFDDLECLQVPAEGDVWRVVGRFDGGDGYLQLEEPSYGFVEFAAEGQWSVATDEPLTVSGEGAQGTVTVHPEETFGDPDQPAATLDVDITC